MLFSVCRAMLVNVPFCCINLLDTDLWQKSFSEEKPQPAKLRLKLKKAGIDQAQIAQAIAWFTHLHASIHAFTQRLDKPNFEQDYVRIYDPHETEMLSENGMRFLNELVKLRILDIYSKEIVLDMLFTLEAYEIDTPLIKWVSLIVLYALPNHHAELLALELLVLDTFDKRVH